MEEWRPILGFENYEVSNLGNVRRGDRVKKCTVDTQHDGYKKVRVGLCKDGIMTICIVSRLVAQAFIPNPDELTTVDHIDRNSTNNHVSNLRWASYQTQNMNKHHPIGASGHRHIRKQGKAWKVEIKRHNQFVFNKCFPTIEAAVEARDQFIFSIGSSGTSVSVNTGAVASDEP
jgi:hypothetical protein